MVHSAVGKFNVNHRTELFYRRFIPSKPFLVLVFIHGAGQHSGQFVDLGRHCLQHNIAFYAFDLRGFGQSTGKRGRVHSFYEYLDDMHKFIGFVREVQVVSRQVVEILRVLLLSDMRHLCRTEVGASNAWLPVSLAIDSKLK